MSLHTTCDICFKVIVVDKDDRGKWVSNNPSIDFKIVENPYGGEIHLCSQKCLDKFNEDMKLITEDAE